MTKRRGFGGTDYGRGRVHARPNYASANYYYNAMTRRGFSGPLQLKTGENSFTYYILTHAVKITVKKSTSKDNVTVSK